MPSICAISRPASASTASTMPRIISAWRCPAGSWRENKLSPRLAATEQKSVEVSIASRFMKGACRILADRRAAGALDATRFSHDDCASKIRHHRGENMRPFLALLASALVAAPAFGQDAYPTRPITMIVPFPPGGVADLTGRPTAFAMEKFLKQRIIVENKAGAGGAIGMAATANSKPDGYTILMALSSISIIPPAERLFDRKPPYEMSQLVPIALISADPTVLVVRTDAPWKTLKEFVEDAKRRPGKINYSSSGMYGTLHVAMEIFAGAAGIRLWHVPYSGGGPAVTALLGGQVEALASGPSAVIGQLKGGKLRALASWGERRLASRRADLQGARLRRRVLHLVGLVCAGGNARGHRAGAEERGAPGGRGRRFQDRDGEDRNAGVLPRRARFPELLGQGREDPGGCSQAHRPRGRQELERSRAKERDDGCGTRQGHHHLRRDRRDPHADDVAAPSGDAGGDRRRRDRRGAGGRGGRAPARARARGRTADAGSEDVHAFPAEDQGGLERRHQSHHRRRADHDGRGAAAAGAAAQARGRLAQHGLDELRAVRDAGALQGLEVRLGEALPRRQRRAHLQEHLQGHRHHPGKVSRQRHPLRDRVLRHRAFVYSGAFPRPQAGEAAALHPVGVRHPRRHRPASRGRDAHEAHR